MISIIICNRKKVLDPKLENNIKSTIGIEYEIINIDNSDNRYNIFQAYNKGIQKSKYPYICFMHDDILYHTVNWGKNIIDYLAPIREKRKYYEEHLELVDKILKEGTEKARKVAKETMRDVKKAMKLDYFE